MIHYWLDLARRPVDQAPVVEKMVLFWSGTLCSSLDKVQVHRALMDQNHTFRTMGLGSFHTLLHTISVGPAMIMYLDNDRNVVGRPNENFARELMELFTTGVGHYTERDVTEAARAWTGYGIDDTPPLPFRCRRPRLRDQDLHGPDRRLRRVRTSSTSSSGNDVTPTPASCATSSGRSSPTRSTREPPR